MKLLNERFNDAFNCNSFIDELDSFDEFDLECISKDYDERNKYKFIIKDVDEIFESMS